MPKQACVCDQIAKSSQKIQVTTDKKRYGKIVTVVTGFDKDVDLKSVDKTLKSKLACGGTYKENQIELQGDHVEQIKPLLVKIGFEEDRIE